jgi:hypothetical protein
MKKLFFFAFTAALGLYSSDSSAQIFRLNFVPLGGLNPTIRAAIDAEVQKAEDQINEGLPSNNNPSRLMEGMANSSVMAGKGIGSDYASGMEVALIGAGIGAGADLEKNEEADSDLSGVGVQGGLLVGMNLGWMETKKILGLETNKLNVYLNFFKYELDQNAGDADVTADLSSYGIHFSYDWIKARPSKWFGWGGVKVHTGYEYNKTELNFKSQINETVTAQEGGGTYTSNVLANPFANINVSTHSIPVEISTSLRFLYLFSIYAGLGADYNTGSATGEGDLNSGSASVTCTGVCPGGSPVGDIETDANIEGKGKASPFLFRGFAGLQVNLPFIRVFVQADKAFGNDLIGATTGVRFVY